MRKDHDQLPKCVYKKHGAYYFVKNNKWIRLGRNREAALLQLRAIIGNRSVSEQIEAERWEAFVDHGSETLLGAKEIIVQAKPGPPSVCGIYFLVSEGEIVYVGQSTNIASRIGNHAAERKQFDSYYYQQCDSKSLDEMESAYIRKFKPRLNKAAPRNSHRGRIRVEEEYSKFKDMFSGYPLDRSKTPGEPVE